MVTTRSTTASPTASKAVVRKTRPKDTRKSVVTGPPATEVETTERPPEPLVFNIPTVDVHLSSRRVVISSPVLPHLSAASPGEALAGLNRAATDLVRTVAGLPERVRRNLPPREKTLFYGGLVALASVGLVGWPTAAAIGTGVWIATRAPGAAASPAPDGAEPAKTDEQPAT